MSNQRLIDRPQNFWLSISHRLHRLVIDSIDYSLISIITHRYHIVADMITATPSSEGILFLNDKSHFQTGWFLFSCLVIK